MTQPNELRKLDVEVCRRCFGRTDVEADPSGRGISWDQDKPWPPNYSAPNSPHALEVLKWCMDRGPIHLGKFNGEFLVIQPNAGLPVPYHEPWKVSAPTFEESICRFALALALSKEGV